MNPTREFYDFLKADMVLTCKFLDFDTASVFSIRIDKCCASIDIRYVSDMDMVFTLKYSYFIGPGY